MDYDGQLLTSVIGVASDLRADIGRQFVPGYPEIWIGPEYPYATIEEKP